VRSKLEDGFDISFKMTSWHNWLLRLLLMMYSICSSESFSSQFCQLNTNHRNRQRYVSSVSGSDHNVVLMKASSTMSTTNVTTQSTALSSDANSSPDDEDISRFEMNAVWALKDNLSKYTVMLTPPSGKPRRYAMWRTMLREVPELSGYPLPFLIQMHKDTVDAVDTPGYLPMVDEFEFASNGGISGRAYGLPGVADGTWIKSPPIVRAEETIQLGYVTTQEPGSDELGFSYELGKVASSSTYFLDDTERGAALKSARKLVLDGAVESRMAASSFAKDVAVTGSGLLSDTESNKDLVYLGGAAAMLLASATAVGMLSHHLTVNMFWV